MAKVKLNPILEQIRGDVGDLVFKKFGDRTIMSRKPDFSETRASESQIAARQRFSQAALFGKMVLADPETKSLYDAAAQRKGQPIFSLTVADFFHAPVVDEVDLSRYSGAVGDTIAVRAHDDFQVMGVTVTLTQTDGSAIESGAAVETPAQSGTWVYTATQAVAAGTTVRIEVAVTDRPGGEGLATEEMTV